MLIGVHPDHPLYGPRLRLAVAHEKTQELRRAISSRINGIRLPTAPVRFDPKTGKNTAFVKTGVLHDPTWPVTVGEICHNLRAALDGLVYQLALLTNPASAIDTKLAFPIFRYKTSGKRNGRHFAGYSDHGGGAHPKLRLLAPVLRPRFERYQPYRRGNGGDRNALWRLHELNNADKHRFLTHVEPIAHTIEVLLRNTVTGEIVPMPEKARVAFRRLERGTEITLPIVGQLHPDVRVGTKMGVDIRFEKGHGVFSRGGVTTHLRKMHAAVKGIIDDFMLDFPGHPALDPPQPVKLDAYYPMPPTPPWDQVTPDGRIELAYDISSRFQQSFV